MAAERNQPGRMIFNQSQIVTLAGFANCAVSTAKAWLEGRNVRKPQALRLERALSNMRQAVTFAPMPIRLETSGKNEFGDG